VWSHNYWTKSNPGGEAFYCKVSNHAFNQVFLHKVSECTWDSAFQTVTTLNALSKMGEIAKFENQDWVQDILKFTKDAPKANVKTYADSNVAFLFQDKFQDDFSIGTIHGTNATKQTATSSSMKAASASHGSDGDTSKDATAIKIVDKDVEEHVSVLTTKTQDELTALLVRARRQIHASIGSWIASGSSSSPGSGPAAMPPSINNMGCQQTAPTNGIVNGTEGETIKGDTSGRPNGKLSTLDPPLYP
jgi:hypothetical protein